MNNIYDGFVHLASVTRNPDVDKADFQLWSLAVSAINGGGAPTSRA
ncbi:hypothetical protein [Bradyrhizobium sp. 169]|nr:hypothetical protein [Bradyrhizobium sp. 169]MCK1590239.1 hypothetical protein [Bradyrhizobium sp. 169]